MPLTDEELRKIARAIWGYTEMSQPALDVALGFRIGRMKEMCGVAKSAPRLDELVALAEYAGVPTAFALDGWTVADPVRQLQLELAELRAEISGLRKAHVGLTADVVRNAQDLRAHRAEDHPGQAPQDGAQ